MRERKQDGGARGQASGAGEDAGGERLELMRLRRAQKSGGGRAGRKGEGEVQDKADQADQTPDDAAAETLAAEALGELALPVDDPALPSVLRRVEVRLRPTFQAFGAGSATPNEKVVACQTQLDERKHELEQRLGERCAQVTSELGALDMTQPDAQAKLLEVWQRAAMDRWLNAFPDDPRLAAVRELRDAKQAESKAAATKAPDLSGSGQVDGAQGAAGNSAGLEEALDPIAQTEKALGVVQRPLYDSEIARVRSIFADAVDYGAVVIERHFEGFDNRPFTICNTIHLGERDFAEAGDEGGNLLSASGLSTLVHEMTHVWQFQHGGFSYIGNSVYNQVVKGGAYEYDDKLDAKVPWSEWGAEEQAQFIEDYNWAVGKMNEAIAAGAVPEARVIKLLKAGKPFLAQIQAGKGADSSPVLGEGSQFPDNVVD